MSEGIVSTALGLRGMPDEAEEVMVDRNIRLAGLTGGQVHIAHISTRGAIESVRRGKEAGVRVTAEVTPHHLLLTEEAVRDYDTDFRMNPPLRTEEDRAACVAGLVDGTIDAIATDHAPHAVHEKEVDFIAAPPGILGFETAFGVVMDLVRAGELSPLELMRRLSTNARRVMDVPGGGLSVGSSGDVVILDPERTWTYDPAKGYSKSRNSPWSGSELTGKVIATVVGGRLVYHCDRGVLLP